MDDKEIKECEARGYSKGYKAGMRRLQSELRQKERELAASKDLRRERIFCAVLNGLLASGNKSNWWMGGEKIHDSKTCARLANAFVDKAMLQMKFQ